MKYRVDKVIERLQRAKEAGKTLIDEDELISIATPNVNNIDRQINDISRAIAKYSFNGKLTISFFEAENLTGIARKTFYRWENEFFFTSLTRSTRTPSKNSEYGSSVNLVELKETLLKIKQIKQRNNSK